jgi:uncharacterized protein YqeY
MTFQERMQSDLQQAMRDKDEMRLSVLRMMKTAIQNKQIADMKTLDEPGCFQVLGTLIKQRKDSSEQFRKGNRPDLADKEDKEILIIESYLPSGPSEEEIENAIAAALSETGITSLKQMGVVMKAAQAKLAGKRVDGKMLSDRVRSKLS